MRENLRVLVLFVLVAWAAAVLSGATKLLVTVVDRKSGRPVAGLKAVDFTVLDQRTPRRVQTVEYGGGLIDVILLLDTSLVGAAVQPVAANLIAQLQPKDQMAVVAFHSSADLLQDFTASRELLTRAVSSVQYGNIPRVLDALYAAIDGGFQSASARRVILLLTTGMEGGSRTSERDAIGLARRNGVSIFPVYLKGSEKSLFENLARATGGASFDLKEMEKASSEPPGARIFEALRSHYTLTLEGSLSPGGELTVSAKAPGKLLVSALPLN
jgi:VWFA-related protein